MLSVHNENIPSKDKKYYSYKKQHSCEENPEFAFLLALFDEHKVYYLREEESKQGEDQGSVDQNHIFLKSLCPPIVCSAMIIILS